jgi:hypothetical protein
MNILKVPVSPFTRRLIIAKYGSEPVRLKASDTLTGELCCIKPGDENKVEKTLATLTENIAFELTPQVARQVNRKRWRVGLHLNNFYRTKLNEYIAAKTEEGIAATTALASWCATHGVEIDIDISFDALYKDWQRFCEEKTEKNDAFFRRQKHKFVHQIGEKTTRYLKQIALFSDTELDTIITQYADTHPALFKTVRGDSRKKLTRQLSLYVYRVVGNRSPAYICRKFGLMRLYKIKTAKKHGGSTTRVDYDNNLRYAVRSFKIFLKTAPPIVLPTAKE